MDRDEAIREKETFLATRKLEDRLPASARVLGRVFRNEWGFFEATVQEAGEQLTYWSLRNVRASWQKGITAYMKAGYPYAKAMLDVRLSKFRLEGKDVHLLEGPYFRGSYYRAQVRVNGRRYGWYIGRYGKWWQTGDDLDKQAAASRLRRRWDTLPTVVLETPSGHRKVCAMTGDLVWVSGYSSIPLIDLSFARFTQVGEAKWRRVYEYVMDEIDWGDGSISDQEEMRRAALGQKGRP